MSYLTLNVGSMPVGVADKVQLAADTDNQLKYVDENNVVHYVAGQKRPNLVRNSGFWFWQRVGSAAVAQAGSATDRTKTADGWSHVGQNFTPSRVDADAATEVGLQGRYYASFLKTTGTGKLLLVQPIEGVDAEAVRSRVVRVQMWARCITGTNTFRLGLIQLQAAGTTDTVPSASFSTALNGAGSDPTLGTNLAYVAPIAGSITDNGTIAGNALTCSVTTAWQRFGAVFTVPSNSKNLLPAIWSDGVLAVNDGLDITQVSVTDGYEVVDWTPNSMADELNRCLRYYWKSFSLDTAPAQNVGVSSGCIRGTLVKAVATALAVQLFQRMPMVMRSNAPTITTYNPAVANAQVRQTGGTAADMTATATAFDGFSSLTITATGAATGALGDQVQVHATVDAEL